MFHGAEWVIVPVYSAAVNIVSAGIWFACDKKLIGIPKLLNAIILSVPMLIVFHSSGYIIPFLLISVFAVYFNELIKKSPVK